MSLGHWEIATLVVGGLLEQCRNESITDSIVNRDL